MNPVAKAVSSSMDLRRAIEKMVHDELSSVFRESILVFLDQQLDLYKNFPGNEPRRVHDLIRSRIHEQNRFKF